MSEVRVKKESHHPIFYEIKSEINAPSSNGAILADWFSGVIAASYFEEDGNERDFISTFYFHIRNGEVLLKSNISRSDSERIKSAKDISADKTLESKAAIMELYEDYTDYHFRLSKVDSIKVGEKEGFLRSSKGMSPLLDYFNNDHLQWPYNWENRESNGAPNCNWIIDGNKVYLTNV